MEARGDHNEKSSSDQSIAQRCALKTWMQVGKDNQIYGTNSNNTITSLISNKPTLENARSWNLWGSFADGMDMPGYAQQTSDFVHAGKSRGARDLGCKVGLTGMHRSGAKQLKKTNFCTNNSSSNASDRRTITEKTSSTGSSDSWITLPCDDEAAINSLQSTHKTPDRLKCPKFLNSQFSIDSLCNATSHGCLNYTSQWKPPTLPKTKTQVEATTPEKVTTRDFDEVTRHSCARTSSWLPCPNDIIKHSPGYPLDYYARHTNLQNIFARRKSLNLLEVSKTFHNAKLFYDIRSKYSNNKNDDDSSAEDTNALNLNKSFPLADSAVRISHTPTRPSSSNEIKRDSITPDSLYTVEDSLENVNHTSNKRFEPMNGGLEERNKGYLTGRKVVKNPNHRPQPAERKGQRLVFLDYLLKSESNVINTKKLSKRRRRFTNGKKFDAVKFYSNLVKKQMRMANRKVKGRQLHDALYIVQLNPRSKPSLNICNKGKKMVKTLLQSITEKDPTGPSVAVNGGQNDYNQAFSRAPHKPVDYVQDGSYTPDSLGKWLINSDDESLTSSNNFCLNNYGRKPSSSGSNSTLESQEVLIKDAKWKTSEVSACHRNYHESSTNAESKNKQMHLRQYQHVSSETSVSASNSLSQATEKCRIVTTALAEKHKTCGDTLVFKQRKSCSMILSQSPGFETQDNIELENLGNTLISGNDKVYIKSIIRAIHLNRSLQLKRRTPKDKYFRTALEFNVQDMHSSIKETYESEKSSQSLDTMKQEISVHSLSDNQCDEAFTALGVSSISLDTISTPQEVEDNDHTSATLQQPQMNGTLTNTSQNTSACSQLKTDSTALSETCRKSQHQAKCCKRKDQDSGGAPVKHKRGPFVCNPKYPPEMTFQKNDYQGRRSKLLQPSVKSRYAQNMFCCQQDGTNPARPSIADISTKIFRANKNIKRGYVYNSKTDDNLKLKPKPVDIVYKDDFFLKSHAVKTFKRLKARVPKYTVDTAFTLRWRKKRFQVSMRKKKDTEMKLKLTASGNSRELRTRDWINLRTAKNETNAPGDKIATEESKIEKSESNKIKPGEQKKAQANISGLKTCAQAAPNRSQFSTRGSDPPSSRRDLGHTSYRKAQDSKSGAAQRHAETACSSKVNMNSSCIAHRKPVCTSKTDATNVFSRLSAGLPNSKCIVGIGVMCSQLLKEISESDSALNFSTEDVKKLWSINKQMAVHSKDLKDGKKDHKKQPVLTGDVQRLKGVIACIKVILTRQEVALQAVDDVIWSLKLKKQDENMSCVNRHVTHSKSGPKIPEKRREHEYSRHQEIASLSTYEAFSSMKQNPIFGLKVNTSNHSRQCNVPSFIAKVDTPDKERVKSNLTSFIKSVNVYSQNKFLRTPFTFVINRDDPKRAKKKLKSHSPTNCVLNTVTPADQTRRLTSDQS